MKLLGWILLLYLIYRLSRFMFGAGKRSVQQPRSRNNVSGNDQKPGKVRVTPRMDDEGEYIDYKEVK
jgi:hypothetical protein